MTQIYEGFVAQGGDDEDDSAEEAEAAAAIQAVAPAPTSAPASALLKPTGFAAAAKPIRHPSAKPQTRHHGVIAEDTDDEADQASYQQQPYPQPALPQQSQPLPRSQLGGVATLVTSAPPSLPQQQHPPTSLPSSAAAPVNIGTDADGGPQQQGQGSVFREATQQPPAEPSQQSGTGSAARDVGSALRHGGTPQVDESTLQDVSLVSNVTSADIQDQNVVLLQFGPATSGRRHADADDDETAAPSATVPALAAASAAACLGTSGGAVAAKETPTSQPIAPRRGAIVAAAMSLTTAGTGSALESAAAAAAGVGGASLDYGGDAGTLPPSEWELKMLRHRRAAATESGSATGGVSLDSMAGAGTLPPSEWELSHIRARAVYQHQRQQQEAQEHEQVSLQQGSLQLEYGNEEQTRGAVTASQQAAPASDGATAAAGSLPSADPSILSAFKPLHKAASGPVSFID